MPCLNYKGRDVDEDYVFGALKGTKRIQWQSEPIDSFGTYTHKDVFKTIYGSYVDDFKLEIDRQTKFMISTYLYYHNDGNVYYFGKNADAKEFQNIYGQFLR